MIGLLLVILMVYYTRGELGLRGVGPILRNEQKQPLEVLYKKRCRTLVDQGKCCM